MGLKIGLFCQTPEVNHKEYVYQKRDRREHRALHRVFS